MSSRYPRRSGPSRGVYRGGRAGSRHGEHVYHGTRRIDTSEVSKSGSRGGELRGAVASGRVCHKHQGADPYRGSHPRGRFTKTSSRTTNPMGRTLLTKLDSAETNEIIRELYENRIPLQLLLKEDIDEKKMQLLVSVLSKACRATNQQSERVKQILEIVSLSDFLEKKLLHWISDWSHNVYTREFLELNLSSITEILFQMLNKVSGNVSSVGVALIVLSSVVDGFEKKDIFIEPEVKEKFNTLQEMHSLYLRDQKELSSRKGRKTHGTSWEKPPDDFRKLPILPVPEELQIDYKPFLRKNIVNGDYRDVDHYLDIHYRLLREDFVAPLREGIAEYTKQLNTKGTNCSVKRFQNFRLYNNVEVVGVSTSNTGLCFILHFDVDNHLKKVKWELSNRLMYGSLVCLSRDGFKTLIFGVVADSDPKQLKNGYLTATFEIESNLLQELFMYSFEMAESSSYFEAYRHVLDCLQEINEGNFPFSQYFITTARKPELPRYIKEDPSFTFDISSIAREDVSKVNVQRLKKISVRNDDAWPCHEKLGFDESQIRAYKAALQEEVCIIQGPPGTGKTYVGLRIVKTLLQNREHWGKNKPLLVICYTNHALDQFLEGILEFESDGVVRIGGRSSNERLRKFNIKEVRRNAQRAKSGKWEYEETQNQMKVCAIKIKHHESLIDVAKKSLLKCRALQQIMNHDHRRSFTRCQLSPLSDPIAFWLSILDEYGQISFQSSNANASIPQGASEPATNKRRPFETGNVRVAEQLQVDGEDTDQSDDDDADQSDEYDTATDTDESIVIDDEELNKRYIDDEDDFSDDELAETNRSLELKSIEQTVLSMPVLTEEEMCEWQKVEKKQLSERTNSFIRQNLSENAVMTEEEVRNIRDIWNLDYQERWSLYRYWVQLYIDQIREKMLTLYDDYNQKATILKELRVDDDLSALRGKSVIGLTTTGAAKQTKLLRAIGPPVVVVEEAAEILEAHVITSLSSYTQHLILIGDHQQLRPNPTVYKLCKEYRLDVSLFERLINNGMPHYRLSLQHRMRPEISHILKIHKDFYPGLLDHEMVNKYENILGIEKNLFFVEHDISEMHNEESKSRSNLHEARYLMSLCKYLLQQGYKNDQITILTAYRGQVHTFRRIMDKTFEGVRVCPIDNFQGEENDIILFSFVRSNEEGNIGFLKVSNRVCVALSRARKGLYCIGNFSLLSQQSELWATIVSDLRDREYIGPGLKLLCRNHPDRYIEAKTSEDFRNAPDGGCYEPCSARLNCGHTCQMKCHPIDQEHREIRCERPCEETLCNLKHVCPLKCWEDCPSKCPTRIIKILPCSHEQQVECYEDPNNVYCESPCEKILPCGHDCQESCGSDCTVSCQQEVKKVFQPCGHKANVPCYVLLCPNQCTTLLKCEHVCQGTCGVCSNGRYHLRCQERCERVLVCGHICKQRCSRTCPPCRRKCDNRCAHNKCKKTCGESCVPCREPCPCTCRHHQCKGFCGSECNRKPCDKPCLRRLECKHKCIGLCGERCPELCRKCNKVDVRTILFGNEDNPRARFVLLDDCHHIVEVQAMDRLMKLHTESEENLIKIPECPWCKTPIRYNKRYNNIIHAIREDVEDVKVRIRGEKVQIESMRCRLKDKIKTARFSMSCGQTSLRFRSKFKNAFFDTLTNMLSKSSFTVSLGELAGTEIFFEMYHKLRDIDIFETKFLNSIELNWKDIKEFRQYKQFHEYFDYLQEKTRDANDIPTEQEIADWQNEYKRCKHSLSLLEIVGALKASEVDLEEHEEERQMIDEADMLLSDGFPFDIDKDDKVRDLLNKLKDWNPLLSKIGISERERQMVVKAMGFRSGHWFKCRNGHVYTIGECGGATERSHCPECQETIGGTSHRLVEGNTLASEMDGARFAAYSEEANNMFNFDLDDGHD